MFYLQKYENAFDELCSFFPPHINITFSQLFNLDKWWNWKKCCITLETFFCRLRTEEIKISTYLFVTHTIKSFTFSLLIKKWSWKKFFSVLLTRIKSCDRCHQHVFPKWFQAETIAKPFWLRINKINHGSFCGWQGGRNIYFEVYCYCFMLPFVFL